MAERVWDRFLTEQDKAHLAQKSPRNFGFGSRPALLLIDLYRWVFGDRPEPLLEAINKWPGSCGLASWHSLPHIQKLLSTARQARIPIIHVTGLDGTGVERWSFRRESSHTEVYPEAADRQKRRFDIVDEVRPIAGETVIKKSSPSAFWGTPLVGHLNFLDIDTLIVCGESTSGCVRASVVDGCTHRYRVIVVEECVFDRHEAAHAMNLFDMNQKYADVLPLAQVVDFLSSWAKAEQPRAAEKNRNTPATQSPVTRKAKVVS